METTFFVIYAAIATVMVATLTWGLYAIYKKNVTAAKYATVQTVGRFALSAWACTALTHYSLMTQHGTHSLVASILSVIA